MTVEMRRARRGDEGPMRALVRRAYAPYVPLIGREPAPMNADYDEVVASGAGWVAAVADVGRPSIIGLLVLRLEPDHVLVENVAVEPASAGRGIGAQLLALAETIAAQHDHHEVRLYTNALMSRNLAYYDRLGFVETHRATVGGFDRVYFTKDLR